MPSWDLFAAQPKEYQDKILPPSVTARVAVEAGSTFGWERYTGTSGRIIGLDRFGASAPGSALSKNFGFTAQNIVGAVLEVLP
jgi:transketolase